MSDYIFPASFSVSRDASMFFRRRSPITGPLNEQRTGIFASELERGYKRVHTRGNILRRRARSLRRVSRAEQMASDISGLYRVFPLIFKILYFTQQIVPIEINPPAWADSCCDNSRHPRTSTYPLFYHRRHSRARYRFVVAYSLQFKVLYSTRYSTSLLPGSSALLPHRCSTFLAIVEPANFSLASRISPNPSQSFPPRCAWFSCFLRRSPIFSYAESLDGFRKLLAFFSAVPTLKPRNGDL